MGWRTTSTWWWRPEGAGRGAWRRRARFPPSLRVGTTTDNRISAPSSRRSPRPTQRAGPLSTLTMRGSPIFTGHSRDEPVNRPARANALVTRSQGLGDAVASVGWLGAADATGDADSLCDASADGDSVTGEDLGDSTTEGVVSTSVST